MANNFAGEKDVVIAKVDATEYGDLATKYDVSGYPTLKFFAAGSSEATDYSGAREVEDMTNFINEKAGTARTADGTLLPTAGRVAALDAVVEAAAAFDDAFLAALKTASDSLVGKDASYAKVLFLSHQSCDVRTLGFIQDFSCNRSIPQLLQRSLLRVSSMPRRKLPDSKG